MKLRATRRVKILAVVVAAACSASLYVYHSIRAVEDEREYCGIYKDTGSSMSKLIMLTET